MKMNNIIKGRIVFCFKKLWLICATVGILIFTLCGCGEKARKISDDKQTPRRGEISKEELREELDNFGKYAVFTISQTADEIDELLPNLKTQKTNLIQRSRMKQAFHTMLRQEDPIIAYIETWALCVRFSQYLQEGEGRKLFGEHQDKAVIAATQIETKIEQIGRSKFPKQDVFEKTRDQIHTFANKHPITGTFSDVIIYVTEEKPGEQTPFANLIAIPMSPFKAMQGVDRTASAIYSVKNSMDRVSDVAEDLPESARWELLLLLLEMEEIEMVKTLLSSMSKLSDSSVRFADSAEKLPEQLRQQLAILIKDIDEKQTNLQTTLDKAEKTSDSVEQAMVQADKVAVSFQSTANEVNQAAAAWENAAKATSEALVEIKTMRTPRKDAAPKAPFNINDYRVTAETVTTTVSELRNLVEEVREFTTSDDLTKSSFAARQWVNHLTWRTIQLTLFIFVLGLVYRVVAVRFIDKRKPNR